MEIKEDNNNEMVVVENQVLLVRPNGGGCFELKIEVEEMFSLEKAVCNHGFFMTAPNKWISSSNTFQRPLRISSDNNSLLVSISQPSSTTTSAGNYLLVLVHGVHSLSSIDQHLILEQVGRMLRISSKDEYDMRMFHEVDAKAKKSGFGRLFRSPDLFEDIIKSILLCNTSWRRTLEMCQALCNLGEEHSANFPSSKELANLDEVFLRHSCRLGYRAKTVIQVAQLIENGKLKLDEFEGHGVVEDTKSYKVLVKVKGIGLFTTANIFMCIGIYHKIPIDTETIEHMIKVHRKKHFKNRTTMDRIINQFYEKFAPYQCLAYWHERVAFYEKKVGERLSKLAPMRYYAVTSGPRKKKW